MYLALMTGGNSPKVCIINSSDERALTQDQFPMNLFEIHLELSIGLRSKNIEININIF